MEEAVNSCFFTGLLYSKIKTVKYNMLLAFSYNDYSCYDFLPGKETTILAQEAIIYFPSLLSHIILILSEVVFFPPKEIIDYIIHSVFLLIYSPEHILDIEHVKTAMSSSLGYYKKSSHSSWPVYT